MRWACVGIRRWDGRADQNGNDGRWAGVGMEWDDGRGGIGMMVGRRGRVGRGSKLASIGARVRRLR